MRSWVIILAAAALTGCRSSQQPTNPFLRTTVPPPGTGEAAVVVPGDPYYPGAAAPAAVAPAPVATGAPVAPQAVAPPPPRERNKAIPGGDLFYHQSSTDTPPDLPDGGHGPDDEGGVSEAAGLAVNAADPDALRLGGPSDAVEQALALAEEPGPVDAASFEQSGGRLPGEPAPLARAKAPQRDATEPTELHYTSKQEVSITGAEREEAAKPVESASEFDSTATGGAGLRCRLA